MFERLHERKEKEKYHFTKKDVNGAIEEILGNEEVDRGFLFRLAGLPTNSKGDFGTVQSKEFPQGIDLTAESGNISFSLVIGETSLLFVNRNYKKDRLVCKSKPLAEIGSPEELKSVVQKFIFSEPAPDEMIDISRETKDRKMREPSEKASIIIANFKKHIK